MMRFLFICIISLVSTALCHAEIIKSDILDNVILAKALHSEDFIIGSYTVVAPTTTIANLADLDSIQTRHLLDELRESCTVDIYGLDLLYNELLEKNKKPVLLTLESSPKDGYFIDYDGKFEKYFEDNGGGWEKWYEENPEAYGQTHVSMPAYDAKTGFVLVYIGTVSHYLSGSGALFAYKYDNGRIKKIGRVMLWIS